MMLLLSRFSGSFRFKIAGAALATACIVLLCAFCLFFARQWTRDRSEFVADRTVSAQIMARNLAAPILLRDRRSATETLAAAADIPDFSRAVLFDQKGVLMVGLGDNTPVQANGAQAPTSRYTAEHLEIHVPVKLDGGHVGELALVLGLTRFQEIIRGYFLFSLLTLAVAATAAGLIAYGLAGRVIRPVERLSMAMGRVRRDADFSSRVEITSQDEFGRLTLDFNALLETLEDNDTELRTAMSDLVFARDAAQNASQIKSQFLANMSHEIRTPLNGVLGMAQVMARDPLSEEQAGRLDVIRSSGLGLLALLNDLLDLSKVEAGKLELENTEFDLERITRLACDPFKAVAETNGLRLTLDIAQAARGMWQGDPVRVRQVIANLVSNAVKFTREGSVDVRIDRDEAGDGGLIIRVADTGVGIACDKIPLLFEKFSQADTSTTREFGGTGLGLAISLELTELMGGQIACDSVEDGGTTFTLRLPLIRLRDADAPKADSLQSAAPLADHSALLRILAAEDNATNQIVLRAMLEPAGVDLFMVSNGAEAVEAWRTGVFDLILMDIQMPVMDGLTAMRTIRNQERILGRPRTPIVSLTANAMNHQVAEYLAAGADGHVSKPIETEVLYAVLDRVLVDLPDAADVAA